MSTEYDVEIELATRTPLPVSASAPSLHSTLYANSGHLVVPELDNDRASLSVTSDRHTSLAPVDRGFKAWTFLAGAFMVQAVVWGFPTAYGVFLTVYLQDPSFASQKNASSLLPLVGNVSSGIMYCSGPFVYPLTNRYPRLRRPFLWIGAFICWASLFSASYATKVEELVLLQGLLYAIGGSLLYAPCMSFLSEWFVEKRGLAIGVIFAGTAVGGLFIPLALPRLLARFGLSGSMRILSVAVLVLLLPFLPFLRPRLPESRVHGPSVLGSTRPVWWRNSSFLLVILVVTAQGFAYFVPLTWLPTFATGLQLSDSDAALTLALVNAFSLISRLSLGYLADKYNAWLLAAFSTTFASLATFVQWGVLSNSFAGLLAFGIAYGSLTGGWSTLFVGFVRPIAKEDPTVATTLLGLLMLSRGLGNVLSTPISSALSRSKGDTGPMTRPSVGFKVAGGRYESMIVYVGTCFAGAAIVAMVGWGVEKSKRR